MGELIRYKYIHETKNLEKLSSEFVKFNGVSKKHSKMHSISSYLAMFNPNLASYFINNYSKEGDLIVDNFSGRGTSLLVCRELNRNFIGTDLNPYAYILSKSKSKNLDLDMILSRVDEMNKEFNEWNKHTELDLNTHEYLDISAIYSNEVLKQLIFIREKYGKNWRDLNDVDTFIISIMFGLMQGKTKKDGTSSYFSVSMPNTFSMSPNYVKNYVLKNNLTYPKESIFPKIINRIKVKYESINSKSKVKIIYGDALKANRIRKGTVDLFFTSPPYLNIINYTNDNWIRLWLLGYDRTSLKTEIKLDDKHNYQNYCNFIKKYLNSKYELSSKNGKMILVVGDINNKMNFEEVISDISDKIKWKLVEVHKNEINSNNKVTKMINAKATTKENIYIFEKGDK